jgi:hypothetical protein
MRAMTGATKLGIEKCGGFASRAVLLDLVRYFDDGPWLAEGHKVTGADLQGACDAQGVELLPGDIALLRFGYLDMWWSKNGEVGFGQAGIGLDAAEWLAAKDVVAVGADNSAIEVVPFDENDFLSGHKVCSCATDLPARVPGSFGPRDECWEALSVAPLKITGGRVPDQPDLRRLIATRFSPLRAGCDGRLSWSSSALRARRRTRRPTR